ncbi:MAG: protein kinase [Deltaproteobacteria bacterium]|nr:protein kinase [Deltaproteobacteria bacterium]
MAEPTNRVDALGESLSAPLSVTVSDAGGDLPLPATPAELTEVDPAHYQIGEEIARGGLGRLLRARDRRLGRIVALKELHQRSAHIEARFRREARITARLQHPGIVPIHEAGRWPNGAPFYVMKLLAGESLKEVVAGKPGLDERLALIPNVLAVAEAIAFAHAERVIHRDLKPANIMLGGFGETVVVDWGLAKELDGPPEPDDEASAPGDVDLTGSGHVLGTAPYMPPEQARGEAVDERADVYALGAVLYFVLAGRAPYHGKDAASILAQVIAAPPARLPAGVPAALLAIVDKAMARSAAQRYPSALELAADLRRFQAGQLVSAHRYGVGERLGRWLRRHRAAVLVALVALVALVTTAGISITRVLAARDRAEAERVVAQHRRRVAEAAEHQATERGDEVILAHASQLLDVDPTHALVLLQGLSPGTAGWRGARMIAADAWSRGVARLWTGHRAPIDVGAFSGDGRSFISGDADGEIRAWSVDGGPAWVLDGKLPPSWLAVSDDGQTVAVSNQAQAAVSSAGRPFRLLPGAGGPLAVSADGTLLARASGDGLLLHWLVDGRERRLAMASRPELSELHAVELSPDGRRLLARAGDRLWVWQAPFEAPAQQLSSPGAYLVRFHPDGDTVAIGSLDGHVVLWQLSVGRRRDLGQFPIQRGGINWSYDLTFSPDGQRLLAHGRHEMVRSWELATGQSTDWPTGRVMDLAIAPDGSQIAIAREGGLALLDRNGQLVRELAGHSPPASHLRFSPDGKWLASFGRDRVVRLWPMHPITLRTLETSGGPRDLEVSPDGAALAIVGHQGELELWDGERPARQLGVSAAAHARFSPDGRWLATGAQDGIWLWPVQTGQPRQLSDEDTASVVGWSQGGATLVGFTRDLRLRAWSIADGSARTLGSFPPRSTALLSPDGTLALIWTPEVGGNAVGVAPMALCGVATGKCAALAGHQSSVQRAAFSPDGSRLATTSYDGEVRVWDAHSGELYRRWSARHDGGQAVFLDNQRLIIGDNEGLRLWELESDSLRVLGPHEAGSMALSRDSSFLACLGRTLRIWDTSSWRSRVLWDAASLPPQVLADQERLDTPRVDFLGDDSVVLSGPDGAVRLWRGDGLPRGATEVARWIATATNARLGPDGVLLAEPIR